MSFVEATVSAVVEEVAGSELALAASSSETEIEVVDGLDFDPDEGGMLTVGDSAPMTYTVDDENAPESLTVPALAGSHDEEALVLLYPQVLERFAYVVAPESDEEIACRIPHTLYDRLEVGTREEDAGEIVVATLDDDEWIISDVLDRAPIIDGSYVNTRQAEEPNVVDTAALTTSYTETGATLTVTPEADGKIMVFWSADVAFENELGDDINLQARVSLLVDGVQVGQERGPAFDGEFASAGVRVVIPVTGNTQVEVFAGVEVDLAIGGKLDATGTGSAYLLGSKSGGLSYVTFAG